MADTIRIIRTATFVLAGVAVALCCAGVAWKRDTLTAAFTLNAAQGALQESLDGAAPPGSVVRFVNVGERSGALVLGLADAAIPEDEAARLRDLLWERYVRAFAAGGYAVSHVAVAPLRADGTVDTAALHAVDVRTVVARTGLAPPVLHPVYRKAGAFNPAVDEPPPLPASMRAGDGR